MKKSNQFQKVFYFLFIMMSIFCCISILLGISEAFRADLKIDNQGFKNLLLYFEGYGIIISSTLTFGGIYFVLNQIIISNKANQINSRNEWRNRLDEKLNEVKSNNPHLHEFINLIADEIYDDLYSFDAKITSKTHLTSIFDKFIKNEILKIELLCKKYIDTGGYNSNIQSYSFQDFDKFLYRLFKPTIHYKDFYNDFKDLYFSEVKRLKHESLLDVFPRSAEY